MPRGIRKDYKHLTKLSGKMRDIFGSRLKTMDGCLDAMEYLYVFRGSDKIFLKNRDYHVLDAGYSILRAEVNGNGDCSECDERYGELVEILDEITKSMRLRVDKRRLKRLRKEDDRGGEKNISLVSLPEDYRDELNCYGSWPLVPVS